MRSVDGAPRLLEEKSSRAPTWFAATTCRESKAWRPCVEASCSAASVRPKLVGPNAHALKEALVESNFVRSLVERGLRNNLELQEGAGCDVSALSRAGVPALARSVPPHLGPRSRIALRSSPSVDSAGVSTVIRTLVFSGRSSRVVGLRTPASQTASTAILMMRLLREGFALRCATGAVTAAIEERTGRSRGFRATARAASHPLSLRARAWANSKHPERSDRTHRVAIAIAPDHPTVVVDR